MGSELPLDGVTVIDCASLLAGPWAATLMGEFGAEVVKVEHPEFGDPVREHGQDGLYWKSFSRNKKSIAVDLHEEEGQEIIKDLVREADVFIENFRPGTLEEWGIGWETLSSINPDLVMARITGFGQTGPYKDRPGFGTLAEAMSGFAYKTGQPDGPPTLPPFGLADGICATYTAFGILSALRWRDTSEGTGQYIDSSILEPIFGLLMPPDVIEYTEKGIVQKRQGNRSSMTAPRNVYRTGDDRWVALSTSAESIAKRVLRLVGGEDLVEDPRFTTMERRVENVEELDAIIQDWMSERTREEVIEEFEAVDAAIAPVYNVADICADPHFQERALTDVEDEDLGTVELEGVFPKLSETPGRIDHLGPALGEHTTDVLSEATAYDVDDVHRLHERGVVYAADAD